MAGQRKGHSKRSAIVWDDEHRVVSTSDNGDATYYRYDDAGKRIIKKGKYGEIFYINPNYTLRNGAVATKHIFAGNSRIATKIVMKERIGGNGRGKTNNGNYGKSIPEEKEIYYYHSDHLGSSNVITRWDGKVHEHVEYFPYGETWVEETKNQADLPYKFTGKELDPETGLYYYGARYYDPRLARWISADPAFGKYLPDTKQLKVKDNDIVNRGLYAKDFMHYPNMDYDKYKYIVGMGGIYNVINNNLYSYTLNNPIKNVEVQGNFAAHWHFLITFKAARDSGKSFKESIKIAWNSVKADFGTQGTDASSTNRHGMAGIKDDTGAYQDYFETLEGTLNFIDKSIKENKLGDATHAGEDLQVGEHRGKKWKGFGLNFKTIKHILSDLFPHPQSIKDAYQKAKDTIEWSDFNKDDK